MERAQKTKICHVVVYKDPQYVRTRTIQSALGMLDEYQVFEAINTKRGFVRYFETLRKLLAVRIRYNPDIYILGFRGHEIFCLVRLVAARKRLIFDEFMSPSDALINEKKLGRIGTITGRILWPLEKGCLLMADQCLTDTHAHKRFLQSNFALDNKRIDVVYVGAETTTTNGIQSPNPPDRKSNSSLYVLFYGTFLPLHGIDIILEACALVRDRAIELQIIGGTGQALVAFEDKCSSLGLANVNHRQWVPFDELQSRYIPDADLCLGGPFGGTPQALRVITGKTFQFLAQSKPTVIGRIDESVGFVDRENCLLVRQADSESLAEALVWALENRPGLAEIGRRGNELFLERFSVECLSRQLASALEAQA